MKLFNRLARRDRRHGPKRSKVDLHFDVFEDRMLLATFIVTNNSDTGPGSLRQAIMNSNATTPGPNSIQFNIAVGAIAATPIPTPSSQPFGITLGPDGSSLWFTEQAANKIGEITSDGTFMEFTLPTANSEPTGIVTGPDGNLWFTEQSGNKIGSLTPTGTFSEFTLPTANSKPYQITPGPNNTLWFTESGSNKIGEITTAGTLTEFNIPTANSGPEGIAAGSNGNFWFTESSANKIGEVTPAGSFVREFTIPTAASKPSSITLGLDGNQYFTEENGNKIGQITTAGAITEFTIPTAASKPSSITLGPDGNLWFTEQSGNNIGTITSSGTITEFAVPTAGSGPLGIVNGPDGNLWFTEFSGNQIGVVTVNSLGLTISPPSDSSLPTITVPVTIDGRTQPKFHGTPLVVISGSGGGGNGLTLGPGSGGSTIEGLQVLDFFGSGILIQSSGNTIGGVSAGDILGQNGSAGIQISGPGADTNVIEGNGIGTDLTGATSLPNASGVQISSSNGNTIGGTAADDANAIGFNTQQGVLMISGNKNLVTQNLYVGTNGPNTPVQSNDIVLVPGANSNQPSPTLLNTYLSGTNLVAEVQGVTSGTNVDLYQLTTGTPGQRIYLGTGIANPVAKILTVFIPKGSIQNGDQIVATATVAANGTSAFSAAQTVADLYTVINTNPSGPGSLYQAILNANAHPLTDNTITFAIPGTAPYVIQPTSALPLPAITAHGGDRRDE